MSRSKALIIGCCLIAVCVSFFVTDGALADRETVQLVVSASDSLAVRVVDPVCASRAEAGQPVAMEVDEDFELSGYVVVAKGTPVVAHVTEAESNGRPGKGGKIVVQLKSVVSRDGLELALGGAGALVELQGNGRGFFGKLFTLFLGKGGDPCLTVEDRYHPHFADAATVRVPRN